MFIPLPDNKISIFVVSLIRSLKSSLLFPLSPVPRKTIFCRCLARFSPIEFLVISCTFSSVLSIPFALIRIFETIMNLSFLLCWAKLVDKVHLKGSSITMFVNEVATNAFLVNSIVFKIIRCIKVVKLYALRQIANRLWQGTQKI